MSVRRTAMADPRRHRSFASPAAAMRDPGRVSPAERGAPAASRPGAAPADLGLGAGQSLPTPERDYFERRLGIDLSPVRLHPDAAAAVGMGARAFTAGRDIGLAPGQWRPGTLGFRHALGHELTHVAQQAGNDAGLDTDNAAETEARVGAMAMLAGRAAPVRQRVPAGALQLSPLSDQVGQAMADHGKGEVFNILRANGPIAADPDLEPCLTRIFGSNADPATETDDRWLADQIVRFGPEPLWPATAIQERERRAHDPAHPWAPEAGNIEATIGVGAHRPPIHAFYFPGTSARRAMIIGGVHGTEQAGVEVVNRLLDQMRAPGAPQPVFSVIVVPSLFPENVAAGQRKTPGHPDPNRQMPAVGTAPGTTDSLGRTIEPENLVLLDLIERFQPERIASVHGHSPPRPGGADMPSITDDPRPGQETADDALTLAMAQRADALGVRVPGNRLGTKKQTTRYPTSSAPHERGVTFGEYGSHATPTRPAMNVITIETYGNVTSDRARHGAARARELEGLATVLHDIFLAP
jgi:hypothetical protein